MHLLTKNSGIFSGKFSGVVLRGWFFGEFFGKIFGKVFGENSAAALALGEPSSRWGKFKK